MASHILIPFASWVHLCHPNSDEHSLNAQEVRKMLHRRQLGSVNQEYALG
jgi:hypothetical protein